MRRNSSRESAIPPEQELQARVVQALLKGNLGILAQVTEEECNAAFGPVTNMLEAQKFAMGLNDQVAAATNGHVKVLFDSSNNPDNLRLFGVCSELVSVTGSRKFRYAPHNPLRIFSWAS